MRFVVSLLNSPTYFMTKFLKNIFKESFIIPKTNVKDSENFKDDIKNMKIPNDHIMVSLDVVALFSNAQFSL